MLSEIWTPVTGRVKFAPAPFLPVTVNREATGTRGRIERLVELHEHLRGAAAGLDRARRQRRGIGLRARVIEVRSAPGRGTIVREVLPPTSVLRSPRSFNQVP